MSSPKLKRVAAALKASGIDGMILLPGANLYYTLGINQMLRKRPIIYAVFPDGSLAASLPLLEVPDFRARWPEAEVVSWTDPEGPEASAKRLGGIIHERAGTSTPRVAAENFAMRIFERSLLLPGLPGTEFEIAEKILDPLRMIKDQEDVDAMRQACRIAEESLVRVIKRFRRGLPHRRGGAEAGDGQFPPRDDREGDCQRAEDRDAALGHRGGPAEGPRGLVRPAHCVSAHEVV